MDTNEEKVEPAMEEDTVKIFNAWTGKWEKPGPNDAERVREHFEQLKQFEGPREVPEEGMYSEEHEKTGRPESPAFTAPSLSHGEEASTASGGAGGRGAGGRRGGRGGNS